MCLVFAAVLFLFRAPLLRGAARVVIYEDQRTPASHAIFLGRERTFDEVGELRTAGLAGEVVILEGMPASRVEQLAIVTPYVEEARAEMLQRGFTSHAITVLRFEGNGDWDRCRALQTWLHDHPKATAIVATNRFQSRRRHVILQHVLSEDDLARVQVMACKHAWYDETDWWQIKYGWLDLFDAYVRLTFTVLEGEGREEWQRWDDEAYARALAAQEPK